MTTEIERKWVAAEVPSPDGLGAGAPLRQGYLAKDGDVEVRVRISEHAATLTVKGGGGLSRAEVECDLTTTQAEALWPFTAGRRIDKVRYRVAVASAIAEVDLYASDLAGLCTVEVEFASEAEANAFAAPRWFGREVTGDSAWSNASLAERGIPH